MLLRSCSVPLPVFSAFTGGLLMTKVEEDCDGELPLCSARCIYRRSVLAPGGLLMTKVEEARGKHGGEDIYVATTMSPDALCESDGERTPLYITSVCVCARVCMAAVGRSKGE